MTISQVKFKADGEVPQSSGPTTAEALEMEKKIKEALAQIEEAESYNSYYTEDEKAKLEKSKAQLMADLQVLEYFLKTDIWDDNMATEAGIQPYLANLDDIEEGGWYVYGANGAVPPEMDDDGTITVPKVKGGVTPLTFVMTSSDDESEDMVGIKFENKGDDIIVTVTYADEHTETYTIKDGAIRPDIQIGVNGLKSEHAITVDASGMLQIDKTTGKTSGIFIIGTKFDGDVLIGSAGDGDSLHGAGGSDYEDGGAGADEVYGYAGTVKDAAGNPISLVDVYGAEALGEDGNDMIVDVYGTDFVEAGGGGNDTVLRGTSSAYTTPDLTAENETTIEPSSPEAITGWLNVSGKTNSKNEYEIDAGKEKDISIEVPEGYMATASTDDNDLVLTFVKQTGAGEEPEYYVVRLSGYFNQEDVTLDITGSFVDMHEVNVGLNTVGIHGTVSAGDVLIGPLTKFDELGMKAEDLGTTTCSSSELEDKLTKLQSDKEADEEANIWDQATVNETGEIEFLSGPDFGEEGLDIPASLGAVAFVQKDGEDLKITVASTDGNESNQVVIRIKDGADKDITIKVNKYGEGYVFNLGKAIGGVTIDGDEGNDLVMGYEYGSTIADPEGVEIKVKKLNEEYKTGTADAKKTAADYNSDITSASDYAKLDSLKTEVKAGFDGEDETDLLATIAEHRAELISAEIEKLDNLKKAADAENATDADKKALQDAITEIDTQLAELKKESDDATLVNLSDTIYTDVETEYTTKKTELKI